MKTGHFSLNLMISKGHIENCVLVILAQLQNTLKKNLSCMNISSLSLENQYVGSKLLVGGGAVYLFI